MNNTDKLKPCPFCGSSEINSTSPPIVVDGVCLWVCPECIAISPLAKSVNDATEKWNTRANESEIAELTKQRDELHELLDWFVNAPDLHKREAAAIMGLPEALNPECPYRRARNALSTQEANK